MVNDPFYLILLAFLLDFSPKKPTIFFFVGIHKIYSNTVEHGRKITQIFLGEHKVITPEQQFLGIILCFFMYLKWLWLLHFFAKML